MRRQRYTWTTILTVCSLAQAQDLSHKVGVYFWGGSPNSSIENGVNAIADMGGHVARLAISPRFRRDYGLADTCLTGSSLTDLASQPEFKNALDNRSIETFLLTSYDGASFGNCKDQLYLNPTYFDANRTAVEQEYSDFVLYLYRTYNGSGKRFIIMNWEGDNTVYCGGAYLYANDEAFRDYCDANYSALYSGNTKPEDSLRGLQLWFEARATGILDGRKRAAALSLGGMAVEFAPEFNIVHALHDAGLSCVLYDVLPKLRFDYVSYSSYESLNNANSAESLVRDMEIIKEISGTERVIVGEAGFSRANWGPEVVTRTSSMTQAALSWGAPYVILWNLFDVQPTDDFGLFDRNGRILALGDYFRGAVSKELRN